MKRILVILALLPIMVLGQKIRMNEFDKFIKQQRIESFPLAVSNASHMKMSVAFSAIGPKLYLQLIGTGLGANRIDVDDKVIFLLDNDSTVVVKSKGYQGFDIGTTLSSYKHHYVLSYDDLETLSQHSVQALRKYRAEDYDDVSVPKEVSSQLKKLCEVFKTELVNSNSVAVTKKAKPDQEVVKKEEPKAEVTPPVTQPAIKPETKPVAIAPGFPGGEEVWTSFLRRNLNPPAELKAGETKAVVVQFLVTADGSVNDIKIVQSAGVPFDKEVLRVLKRMPKWKAAIENGRPVDAIVTQSVTFLHKEIAGVL